jgi:hypothetical protein
VTAVTAGCTKGVKESEAAMSAVSPLPEAWRRAYERDAAGLFHLADPLPERRLARLLGAFVVAGLIFLVFPGTLIGVWNLLTISRHQHPHAASAVWIQAHGHAQLFGWVGTFIIGISLYTFPKFRGARLRSVGLGWAMWAAWTAAIGLRWSSAAGYLDWKTIWPASAWAELAVALLLVWQVTGPAARPRRRELWEVLIYSGFAGLAATLVLQLFLVRGLAKPAIPPDRDSLLIWLALWVFCFPTVWGYSVRFLPAFLGLRLTEPRSGYVGLGLLGASIPFAFTGHDRAAAVLVLGAVAAACWSLRIFLPSERPAKVSGVDPRYPWFARAAFGWLALSATLALWSRAPGFTGASRHAFTVGFMATLILSIGPRILPSFLNSRELWSRRTMLVSLVLLSAGCLMRVASEPLAYSSVVPGAWDILPVSALLELSALLLFAINIGKTLAAPMPAWFGREQVKDTMPLYWYVTSYPATRPLLIEAGLRTLARARDVPKSLTLREAVEADGADLESVLDRLGDFFESRMARALKSQQR